MKTKPFYFSKSLWGSLALFCTGMADMVTGEPTWQGIVMLAMGAVMAYIRTVTDKPITYK